jgi:selenocysteine-specific elongation factor
MPSSISTPQSPGDSKNDSTDVRSKNKDHEENIDDTDDEDNVDIVNINVGVLGHVDSGKTSLVKALSTLLSTAALDKSQQSRQRGMTLDLGFSCFFLNQVPPQIADAAATAAAAAAAQQKTSSSSNKTSNNSKQGNKRKQRVQITLVDCPGHASLIRTIIGAAQIIDMVLLVVDAVKGWQAQTTECLVLAELLPTRSNSANATSLVVALNKTDAILGPVSERSTKLEQAKRDIWERLKTTRYANAPIVGVAACVGGEKVAAITNSSSTANANNSVHSLSSTTTATPTPENTTSLASAPISTANETYNLPELIRVLSESLPVPKRFLLQQQQQQQQKPDDNNKKDSSSSTSTSKSPPFYYSIDHCFSIRGRGTVLTGTVLRGSVHLNQVLEFPTLGRLERKVKSMQMFQRNVAVANAGDRVGICVTSLDSKLLERGMAAQPGSVPLLSAVLCLVRKVPYYTSGPLMSGSKFHVSVGHTTVMATVTFWGARELATAATKSSSRKSTLDNNDFPSIQYDFTQDYLQQDRLLDSLQDGSNDDNDDDDQKSRKQETGLMQWALLDLATPIYCPLDSLVIGSRLDLAATNESSSTSTPSTNTSSTTAALATTAVTTCRLAFSGRLLTPLQLDSNNPADSGNALSRIRLYNYKERRGVISKLGDAHRRNDDGKTVRYEVFGSDLFKKETNMKAFIGMKVQVESTSGSSKQKNKKQQEGGTDTVTTTTTTTTICDQSTVTGGRGGDVGEIKSSYGTDGKFRVFFPAGTEAKEGDVLVLKFQRFLHDKTKAMHQSNAFLKLAPARPGTRLEKEKKSKKQAAVTPIIPAGVCTTGEVVSVKGDVVVGQENGGVKKLNMAIVSGFFDPKVNVKEHLYQVKIPFTGEQGTIVGPFGKAGKVKVSFPSGISESAVGSKAELLIKPK